MLWGEVALFGAESPDHAVAAYHERHGRQNRLPDGVGPVSSPLVTVPEYWLYRFETQGVYDLYCPTHDPFGMVCRIVVTDGDVPDPSVENVGETRDEATRCSGGYDRRHPYRLRLRDDESRPARRRGDQTARTLENWRAPTSGRAVRGRRASVAASAAVGLRRPRTVRFGPTRRSNGRL